MQILVMSVKHVLFPSQKYVSSYYIFRMFPTQTHTTLSSDCSHMISSYNEKGEL